MVFLITGGLGFIGSELIYKILANFPSSRISVIDDFSKGSKERIPEICERVDIYQGKIEDIEFVNKIFEQVKPSYVFHLAAKHYIPDCEKNPELTRKINVDGTRGIAQLCFEHGVERLVFASSASVYEAAQDPHREEDSLKPSTIYGQTKLSAETEILNSECIYTVLRLFNVYGPRDTNAHLIPSLARQIIQSDKIYVGNLDSYRDYVHVQDVASCMIKVVFSEISKNQIYNVATGTGTKGTEVLDTLLKQKKEKVQIITDTARYRAVDDSYLVGNIDKIKNDTGWSPQQVVLKSIKIHEL